MLNQILLYCRAGFEKELAAEITARASDYGIFGFAKAFEQSALVLFTCHQEGEAERLMQSLSLSDLIFARQWWLVVEALMELDTQDRITPIVQSYQAMMENSIQADELVVETPDSDDAKALSPLCRKLAVPLRKALRDKGLLSQSALVKRDSWVLAVVFTKTNACFVCVAEKKRVSPNAMGILRLKLPHDAPSRSTLKLEEAFHTFLTPEEQSALLNHEKTAVDLGACPGGWTYQLVKRNVYTYAVDHGKMAQSLLDSGLVNYCAEDGFHFKPPKGKKVDWLVCDMVESPQRITQLISKWLTLDRCSHTIFNLKLPMKKRFAEVELCLGDIHKALKKQGIKYRLQAKQLYHDREEITVCVVTEKE
ncbi:MAG: 23S rRNA (cytidine(2498)-2'-O)-methyltransferase RlmM [Cardiobacteriaceae bacterium]|nr:23S rRNA (cytidine(2498)-2'-O)-methyltransferase RlmM [Cardiobacteriaceae bacterium]